MEKIHVGRTIFEMETDAKSRLSAYLAQLKDYVIVHDAEIDVYEDIESRIEERLDRIRQDRPITDADIAGLIAEIGSPEAIFGTTENDTGSATKPPYEKIYRNSRRGKIFGVCYGLGQAYSIEPIWIRLALIALTFLVFYVTIPVYVIAAIVMKDDPEGTLAPKAPEPPARGFERLERAVRSVFEMLYRLFDKIIKALK
jgi:phage shock protein PspC (stress-responsive transcriptional regulator)